MDFATLPPEINSGLMYAGPGSGPMMAAAAAWNNLGAELSTAAASCQSVISTLTGEEWLGPASAAMATAAAPYLTWMNSTAAAAERAASQATASAAAYEAAYAATVPPPLIAANRAQLASLVATNFLGQNTPAIAATEAQYGEMWAQDAAAMYGYQGSSASAATLNPLTSPTPTTNPAGAAGQAAAVSQAAASGTAQNAASSTAAAATNGNGFLNDLVSSGSNIGIWNDAYNVAGTAGSIGAWNGFEAIVGGAGLNAAQSASSATAVAPAGLGAGLGTVLAGSVAPAGTAGLGAGSAGFGAGPVLANMGQASTVGEMSVPANWSAATPAPSAAPTLAGWTAPTEEGPGMTNVAAGMPAVASAGRGGYGFGAPRYGVKPIVMPRSVVVG